MTTTRLLTPSPAAVAELLCMPCDENAPLDEHLRLTLLADLASAGRSWRRPRLRLDAFVVEHGRALRPAPFAWSTRAARRSLGTRAARLVSCGDEPDLLTATKGEIDRQCDRARRGLTSPGSLGAWLAGTSSVVRATCAVEAASWASGLLVLLSPDRTGIRVGIADAWFDVPGAPVTLHGRRDASSVPLTGERGGIVRLADGVPGPRADKGLLVDGLVSGLAASDGLAPSRVLGAWPDAGVVLAVDLDMTRLREAAALVTAAAAGLNVDASQLVAA